MLPLYAIGPVDWLTSQALYHTLPTLDEEGVVLCWPKTPYVSLGCHQDWADFNQASGLPVVRRRVGGTLVYLDSHQVFYQIIVSPQRIARLTTPSQWYEWALSPVVRLLQSWGLNASLHPPADVWVDSRKISGNAGGSLDDKLVVVGNILIDFPISSMVEARFCPTPKFSQAFENSLRRSVTTLRQIAPSRADVDLVMDALSGQFQKDWGAVPRPFPWASWQSSLSQMAQQLTQDDWLRQSSRRRPYYEVKVQEGRYLRALRDPHFAKLTIEYESRNPQITHVWGWTESPLPLPLTPQEVQRRGDASPGWGALCQLIDLPTRQASAVLTN